MLLLIGYIAFKELSKSAKEKKWEPIYRFFINYCKFLSIAFMIFSISYIGKLILEILSWLV